MDKKLVTRMRNRVSRFQKGGNIPASEMEKGPGVNPLFPPSPFTKGPGFQVPGTLGGGVAQAYQQGGAVQNDQQAFVQYLAQIFGVQSEEELKNVIQKLGQEGIKQLEQSFKQGVPAEQVRNQMSGGGQQIPMARRGMRVCPEGTRLIFKNGGCMCKKMQAGSTTKKRFDKKAPIKKKHKIVDSDTIHIDGKPRDLSGKTKYPKLTNKDYQDLKWEDKIRVELKEEASGRSAPQRKNGGLIRRFKDGGQMGGEFQTGIGAPSVIDYVVGRPKMKCGGKTKKKLVSRKK